MTISLYRFGQYATDTLANMITLKYNNAASITARYSTLVTPAAATNVGTAYQVPAAKTLTIIGFNIFCSTLGDLIQELGYGDTSVSNSATHPTNFVCDLLQVGALASVNTFIPYLFSVPTGKYPYINTTFSSAIQVFFYGTLS